MAPPRSLLLPPQDSPAFVALKRTARPEGGTAFFPPAGGGSVCGLQPVCSWEAPSSLFSPVFFPARKVAPSLYPCPLDLGGTWSAVPSVPSVLR